MHDFDHVLNGGVPAIRGCIHKHGRLPHWLQVWLQTVALEDIEHLLLRFVSDKVSIVIKHCYRVVSHSPRLHVLDLRVGRGTW